MTLVTNRGRYLLLGYAFRNTARPSVWYAGLGTNTTAPTVDTNTVADISQIATGNGYTSGGISLSLNSTDFDVYTEDDTNDRALIQIRDLVWTASGGPIPSSGVGARWLYLSDDNGTESARQIVAAWDFGSAYSVSTGQTITVQNAEIRVA